MPHANEFTATPSSNLSDFAPAVTDLFRKIVDDLRKRAAEMANLQFQYKL